MPDADHPSASSDLYDALAPRLRDEEQCRLLRGLIDQLRDGGGPAVREEVRRRLQQIVGVGAGDEGA